MLVETMNDKEVGLEVFRDWDAITNSTTFERIGKDYDKLRRKNKTDKLAPFFKYYEIKTAQKNKWVFLLRKENTDQKYDGLQSIAFLCFTYYYTGIGLRVLKIIKSGGLSVFNGHVFQRYNERMKLNMTLPLDVVKHFFIQNGFFTSRIVPKENREFIVGTCIDGMLLGEVQNDSHWVVFKTFLNRELLRPEQQEEEVDILLSLQDIAIGAMNKQGFKASLPFKSR